MLQKITTTKTVMTKIIFAMVGLFMLSGCTDGFRGYFKTSANNKLFDMYGSKGGKRKPLYNKKYIALAKKNVLEENYGDEEYGDSEDSIEGISDPAKLNRQIYLDMIKRDARKKERQRLQAYKKKYNEDQEVSDNSDYPSLGEVNEKVKQEDKDNKDLQKEIAEIKSMLQEAKSDLVKYKCPMQKSGDSTAPKASKNSKATNVKKDRSSASDSLSEYVEEERTLSPSSS